MSTDDSARPAKGSLWHVGVLVRDFDAAMAELSSGVGIEWCPVQTRESSVGPFRLTFSTVAPFIELIEGKGGPGRDASDGPCLHHLAFWTDEFVPQKERLLCAGFDLELEGSAPFGGSFCYTLGETSGVRVELTERTSQLGFLSTWGLTLPEVLS